MSREALQRDVGSQLSSTGYLLRNQFLLLLAFESEHDRDAETCSSTLGVECVRCLQRLTAPGTSEKKNR